MAATPTIQIPLGFQAPDFNLFEPLSGKHRTLKELQSDKATIVMFICNHCPFVKHVIHELISLTNDYLPKGVSVIGINSNDVENYPEDSPQNMKKWVEELSIPFTYLFDEDQSIAKAYSAACTPDFNIFDGEMKCIYRGQLDSSRPGNDKPINGEDIRAALEAILNNEKIKEPQIPSIGCNIKWKK